MNITKAPLTMSSLEIARMTNKKHNHVCRDIRVMLETLYKGEGEKTYPEDEGSPEYDRGSRKQYKYLKPSTFNRINDHFNKHDPDRDHEEIQGVTEIRDYRGYVSEYILDKSHSITLVAGYDAALRKRIIDRWQELEKQSALSSKAFDLGKFSLAAMRAIKMGKALGLEQSDAVQYGIEAVKKVYGISPLDLASVQIPVQIAKPEEKSPSNKVKGKYHPPSLNATQLGKEIDYSAKEVNLLLQEMKLLDKDSAGNWVVTEKGSEHGEMLPFKKDGNAGYRILWSNSVLDAIEKYVTGEVAKPNLKLVKSK